MSEWLGAFVDHCVVKLLGGIGQCRAARHCQGLGGMLEAMNTGVTVKLLGRTCGCIRPSSCLVAGCTLVAGTLTGFRSPLFGVLECCPGGVRLHGGRLQ